jgi:cellulose synthase/poly-beta-1,6-N-acetylglucosamine synthase-like glycosyltransferase
LNPKTMTHQLPISVCMIVRDEEIHLPDALASVRSIAEEIIVLDTGSVDRTVEIATAMGARVLTYDWQDDFAAARNVSIEAARHDWILVLDADQRLAPDMYSMLSRAITQPCMARSGYSGAMPASAIAAECMRTLPMP